MQPNTMRSNRRALVALGAAVALTLSGCGSRLEQARLEATNNVFKKVVDTQTTEAAAPSPGNALDSNVTAGSGVGAAAGTPGGATGSSGASSSVGTATG